MNIRVYYPITVTYLDINHYYKMNSYSEKDIATVSEQVRQNIRQSVNKYKYTFDRDLKKRRGGEKLIFLPKNA